MVRELRAITPVGVVPPMPPPEPNPLDRLAGGIFVGREQVMADLHPALAVATGGRPRVVMLVGEPGIGKTRTAEELATYARLARLASAVGSLPRGGGRPRLLAVGSDHPLVRARVE